MKYTLPQNGGEGIVKNLLLSWDMDINQIKFGFGT